MNCSQMFLSLEPDVKVVKHDSSENAIVKSVCFVGLVMFEWFLLEKL
jgi:hypothetical protein